MVDHALTSRLNLCSCEKGYAIHTGDLLCFSFLQFALNPWSLQNHLLVILVYHLLTFK